MDEFNQNLNNEETGKHDTPMQPEPDITQQPESNITEQPQIDNDTQSEPQNTIGNDAPVTQSSEPAVTEPFINENNTVNYGGYSSAPQSSVWQKVEYSPVGNIDDYKPMAKGMKVFCFIMAAVIALTAATTTGYFVGRNSVSNSHIGNTVNVELDARPTNKEQSTPSQVYNMLNESVVGIRVYNEAGQQSDASGVFYSEDGYIVTNDHIYSEVGAAKFKVFTFDGTEYDADYVAGDTVSDLAVLKIKGNKKFKVAQFGDSSQLINGEDVVAIGRPNDATDSSSITSGIISLTSRRVKTTSSYTARLIQTDSAINPGSSGGALVNMYGQVIGITSSKLAGVEYDAIGFAIPTKTMKRVVEQLIKDGKVTDRAKLGITYTEVNSVTAEIENYAAVGLLVVSVGEDSDVYGKLGEGDIITHVNGTPITNDEIVLDVIEDCKAGDTISLTVLHADESIKDYQVKLGANIGESSYSKEITQRENPSGNQLPEGSEGGIFDFPFGE